MLIYGLEGCKKVFRLIMPASVIPTAGSGRPVKACRAKRAELSQSFCPGTECTESLQFKTNESSTCPASVDLMMFSEQAPS